MSRTQAPDPRRESRDRLLQLGTDDHYEDAQLYDVEYADQRSDIDWYRSIADEEIASGDSINNSGGSRKILELGAGTGRITIPLALDGHNVLALDRKQEMLDELQRKFVQTAPNGRIESQIGDIEALPYADASVRLVIAPFNVLMHLYTWKQLLRCFQEVARVLEPGGLFAFDVLLPDLDWLNWDPDKRHSLTRFREPHRGEWLLYSTNHIYDPATQVCHIKIYYDRPATARSRSLRGATPVRTVHLAHRQIFPEELRVLLPLAGFRIESHEGDFGDCSLQTGVETQALRCRKILPSER